MNDLSINENFNSTYTSTLLELLTYSQRMSPVQCLVLLCCYFGQLFPQLVYGRFIVAG